MSRSGYRDDWDPSINLWRANVHRTLNSKRGQAFLREMLDALDAVPDKRLIADALIVKRPEDTPASEPVVRCDVCAIGSVGRFRGIDMEDLDPEVPEGIAKRFGISSMMVQEIEYVNDEQCVLPETSEERWQRVRNWVEANIHD